MTHYKRCGTKLSYFSAGFVSSLLYSLNLYVLNRISPQNPTFPFKPLLRTSPATNLISRRHIGFLFCPSTTSQSPTMLKLLSSSSRDHCLTTATPSLRVKLVSNSVFHALGRLTGLCKSNGSDSKASSAVVPTYTRPENYLTVSFRNYESFWVGICLVAKK